MLSFLSDSTFEHPQEPIGGAKEISNFQIYSNHGVIHTDDIRDLVFC